MPTETVYGLAADATNDRAVAAIYAAKGRPAFNPLIAHVADADAAAREGAFDDFARRLAAAFWPGPLTIVAPVARELPGEPARARRARHARAARARPSDRAGADRGGGRSARRAFGQPLRPRQPDHRRPCRRRPRRPDRLDPRRRPGAARRRIDDRRLPRRAAAAVAPRRADPRADRSRARRRARRRRRPAARRSRRASSRRTTRRARGSGSARANVAAGEAALDFGGALAHSGATARLDLSPSGDLEEAAAHLFAYLRALDDSGATRIAAAPIPERGLGVAINDRLRRAAAPRGDEV